MPDGGPVGNVLGTAAEHGTTRVPVARPTQTVGDVRAALVGQVMDCADDVAVLEGRTLVGVVPIERLLAARGDARVADVMDADPPVVAPGADQELAACRMVRRGESSIAVVDADATSSLRSRSRSARRSVSKDCGSHPVASTAVLPAARG